MFDQHTVLVLPGYQNSLEGHWQTRWEAAYPQCERVPMTDWHHPQRDAWCRTLDASVAAASKPVLFAAHSLGCLTVAFWAAQYATPDALAKIVGALLVALPDSTDPQFPQEIGGFVPVPLTKLPFRSTVVASSDDPYCGLPFARQCANAWGSEWFEIGPRGHINANSGLGDWKEGVRLLATMGQRNE